MLGLEVQDILKDPDWWQEGLHPEDQAGVLADRDSNLISGHQVREFRFRHKDGTYRWIRDEARLVQDGSGKPVEIIGCWSDITDRKRAEEELRERDIRLRLLDDEGSFDVAAAREQTARGGRLDIHSGVDKGRRSV